MTDANLHKDDLPPIWNIRTARCPEFTGRSDLLDALGETLNKHHVCVLAPEEAEQHGIGVTTLAREYAYAFAKDYQVVWWVNAEHLAAMGTEFAQLGKALDIIEQKDDKPFYSVQQIRRRLDRHLGWLLIFDNVPDPDLIASYIPEEPDGHVIVTTTQPVVHTDLSTLTVRPLQAVSSSDAIDFGMISGNLLSRELLQAYQVETGRPIEKMVAAVQQELKKSDEDTWARTTQTVLRYPLSLLTEQYPASKDFLALCSFFSPNDIPLTLFENTEKLLSPRLVAALGDEDQFDQLLQPLLRLGLMRQDENSLAMHPAVQQTIRGNMNQTPFNAWSNAAVKLLGRAFPFEPKYDTPNSTCRRLIPHVLHACNIAEQHNVALEHVSTLLYHAGLYVHAHRLLEEAQMCYLRSINIAERKLGTIHQTIATRVNNLGIVEHELGNLDNAQTCFERAMEICETIYGPTKEAVYSDITDSMLTMPLRNLCKVLEEKGNVPRAQRAFEKAMKTFVDVYGWNHSVVAECAHSFGNTWIALGKYAKAQNCFIKAVRAEENARDCDNAALARYLNSLGNALLKNGNGALAAEQVARALRLDQKHYGEQHVVVARDLILLGNAYKHAGRIDDAEAVYRDALTILENSDDDAQAELTAVLLSLGSILAGKNEYAQARTMLDQSLRLHEELYGSDSPKMISVQVNLGKALDGLEASSQARALYEEALDVLQKHDADNHVDHATILYRLGRSNEKEKKYDEARKYYEKAMFLDTQYQGQNHPNVARDAYGLGSVLIHQGDTIVAMGHLTFALDIYEAKLGKDHNKTRAVRKKLDQINH